MTSTTALPQESPIPKERHHLARAGLVIALIVICVLGLPISYFIRHSTGYDSGYQIGTNKGYLEGFDEGWESGKF